MNPSAPYISVVVTARNDNHGGNMLGRMQAFLDAWTGQAARYDLPSEIIVVEWNPPPNRPKLMDCLRLPDDASACDVRFVEVPAEIHRRFANPDAIPLHQMAAKNAGIRRARGEFVLSTNLDIVYSAELMRFFAERRLEKRTQYRMDRHDVDSEIPEGATLDELLAFCNRKLKRVFSATGSFQFSSKGLRCLEDRDIVTEGEGIRFGAGWYGVEQYVQELFRWMSEEAEIILERPRDADPRLLLDLDVGPSARGGTLTLEVLDAAGTVLASTSLRERSKVILRMPDNISSAVLRLRVRGDWVALETDARFLRVRLFDVMWNVTRWSHESAAPARAEQSIRIRSVEARRVELALTPQAGANLENLGVTLRDRAGNELMRIASDRLQTAGNEEYFLTLDAGFTWRGESEQGSQSGWAFDIIGKQAATDWAETNQHISPYANQMRNPAYLHSNGCGDFTLMSREDWFALRGYAEFPIWPMHIDTMLCYAAHHAGIREVILREPMRIFHIEHLTGAGWTPEGEEERVARIEAKGVSVLHNKDLVHWIGTMRRFNAPAIFTLSNWGLAGVELTENRWLSPHLQP